MNKLKQSTFVSFMAIILVFTSSCYADDNDDGYYYRYTFTNIGAIAAGISIIGVIALLTNRSNAESIPTLIPPAPPVPPVPITLPPVILSGSNYNLLSVNGSFANGKIVVKNNGINTVGAFTATVDNTSVIIDPNSLCFTQPTPAGGQCEINVSYTGVAVSNFRTNARLTIVSGATATATNSDVISLSVINVAPNTLFNPSYDDTRAMGVGEDVFGFAKVNKNGVDFIYVASYGGGVFKSSDGGASWIGVNTGLTNKNVRSLCLHSDGYLYAGTDGNGVFRTNDGGAIWLPVNDGLANLNINCFLSVDNYLYIGTNGGGVFRTNNSGASWEAVNNGLTGSDLQVRSLGSTTGLLFAGTAGGVRLFNLGHWTHFGIDPSDAYSLCIIGDNLFAGTSSGIYKANIFGGIVWTLLQPFSPPIAIKWVNLYSDGSFIYAGVATQVVTPNDTPSAFSKLYRAPLPNGTAWVPLSGGTSALGFSNVNNLFADGSNLYAGTPIGVYKSNDNGTSWTNSGVAAIGFSSGGRIHIISGGLGDLYAGIYGSGVFTSNDQGANWTVVNSGLTDKYILSIYLDASLNYIYAGTNFGGVFRINDGGTSWTPVNGGLGLPPLPVILSLYWEKDSLNDHVYAGTSGRQIYRLDNGGITWTLLPNSPSSLFIITSLYSIFLGGTTYLYAGTDNGVYLSTDFGANWILGGGNPAATINTLFFNNSSFFFAGSSNGNVYKSSNGGFNWFAASPPSSPLRSVFSLFGDGHYLFAGTQIAGGIGGVFRSSDDSTTWTAFSNAITGITSPDQLVYSVREKDGYIYAGCSADGIVKALVQ